MTIFGGHFLWFAWNFVIFLFGTLSSNVFMVFMKVSLKGETEMEFTSSVSVDLINHCVQWT